MTTDCEVQCSLTKSGSDEQIHKEIKFSYKRELLLPLAELDACKKLPTGFDSIIFCELIDASADLSIPDYSDSEYTKLIVDQKSFQPEEKELHTYKDLKFSYTREFLLRIAELDICKNLPSDFNSSVLCELEKASNNSSTTFCTLSGSALVRPYGSVGAEVTAPKVQGSSYHLHSSSEHSNASTGLLRSPMDSDTHDAEPLQNAGRWNSSQPKHSWPKPEDGFIGRGAVLRNPQCPDGTLSQTIPDSKYHLLNTSDNPYRPPPLSKMNPHSRTELRDLTVDSPGLMRNHKPIEGQQYNVSDNYKQNWGLKTHCKGSRNHDGILGSGHDGILGSPYHSNKGVLSSRSDDAWSCSSEQASTYVGKSPATNSARYLEKGFQTKSFIYSSVPEDDNIKADLKSSMFPSSENVDQISEGEKNLAGGISTGKENCEYKMHTKPTEYADKNGSRKFSCQRNEVSEKLEASATYYVPEKVSYQLCSSVTSKTWSFDPEQGGNEPANLLEMSGNHPPLHRRKLSDVVEEQSNVSSHSRSDSSQHLALSKKGIDVISGMIVSEAYAPSSKISNGQESQSPCVQETAPPQMLTVPPTASSVLEIKFGHLFSSLPLDNSENPFSTYQPVECSDMGKLQSISRGPSDSKQHLLDLLEKGRNLEAASSMLNSFNENTSGSLDGSEDHSSQNQCKEYYDIKNAQLNIASQSGLRRHLNDLLKKGEDEADVAAVCSNINSSVAQNTDSLGENSICEPIHEGGSTEELQLSSSPELSDMNSSSDEIYLPDEDKLIAFDDWVGQMDSVSRADINLLDADLDTSNNRVRKPDAFSASLGDDKLSSNFGNSNLGSNYAVNLKKPSANRDMRGSYSYPHSRKNTRISPFRGSEVRSSASKIHSYDCIGLSVLHPAAYQIMIPSGFPQQSNGLPIGAHSDLLVYYSSWLNQNLYQIYGLPNPDHNRIPSTEEAKQNHFWWLQS